MPETCSFVKKQTLEQVFSSEFCEIFKNTFFIELTPLGECFLTFLQPMFFLSLAFSLVVFSLTKLRR